MSNINDKHPAFMHTRMSALDSKTGLLIRIARYRTDHPDYAGGDYVEVYDRNGDLLDDNFADASEVAAVGIGQLGVGEVEDPRLAWAQYNRTRDQLKLQLTRAVELFADQGG